MDLSSGLAVASQHASGQITAREGDISFTGFKELRNHFFSKKESDLRVSIEPLKDFKFDLKAWKETAEKTVEFCEKEIWQDLLSEKTCEMFDSFEEWHRMFKLAPKSFLFCAKKHTRMLGLMQDREKLFDCARICQGMYNSVSQEADEKKALIHEPKRAIVVRDMANKVQALATFSFETSVSDYCTLTHIVSAPQNIKTDVIKNEKSVRGAGRAALVRAIFMTVEKHLTSEKIPDIFLYVDEAFRPSIGFYISCGMHGMGRGFAFTPKEAKEFLENEKLHPVSCLDQKSKPV